jgi:hypothetical protein
MSVRPHQLDDRPKKLMLVAPHVVSSAAIIVMRNKIKIFGDQ